MVGSTQSSYLSGKPHLCTGLFPETSEQGKSLRTHEADFVLSQLKHLLLVLTKQLRLLPVPVHPDSTYAGNKTQTACFSGLMLL